MVLAVAASLTRRIGRQEKHENPVSVADGSDDVLFGVVDSRVVKAHHRGRKGKSVRLRKNVVPQKVHEGVEIAARGINLVGD